MPPPPARWQSAAVDFQRSDVAQEIHLAVCDFPTPLSPPKCSTAVWDGCCNFWSTAPMMPGTMCSCPMSIVPNVRLRQPWMEGKSRGMATSRWRASEHDAY